MLAKMFPHLKLLLFAVYGPHSWLWLEAKNRFFIKFGVFYNKSKILTILFIVKYETITLSSEFLVLSGPIISTVFLHVQMRKKIKQKQQRVLALVLSLWGKRTKKFKVFHQIFLQKFFSPAWLASLPSRSSSDWASNPRPPLDPSPSRWARPPSFSPGADAIKLFVHNLQIFVIS
jgi:hypothetical protein